MQSFDSTGTVAWGNGEIAVVQDMAGEAVGLDGAFSSLAVRKAVSLARKQMLDMVLAVRIDGRQTVSAYLAGNSDLAAQVRGLIQNSLFKGPGLYDEGGAVQVSEKFRGPLAEMVLPTTLQFQSGIPPRLSTSTVQGMSLSENAPEEVGSGTRGYTGVVIDARGLNVTPALAPVIFGQDGFGAYGPFLLSRANAVEKGVAAYAVTDAPEVLSERAGTRPLLVKALSAYGSWRTDLIVSSSDARLMRTIAKTGIIADGCKVVIIVDAPEDQPEAVPAPNTEETEGGDNA